MIYKSLIGKGISAFRDSSSRQKLVISFGNPRAMTKAERDELNAAARDPRVLTHFAEIAELAAKTASKIR